MLHHRLSFILLSAILAGTSTSLIAQDSPAREPAAALSHAIRVLTAEAREAKKEWQLPRTQPDFAASYPDPVQPEMLAKRLERPIDRDPFVDAYVRWQLTGFDAALPEMNDRAFEKFTTDLPKMVASPRADQTLINDLQRIQQIGELSESQQEQVNTRLDKMAEDTSAAADMNLPAEQFRAWVLAQWADNPVRAITLAMEHAAARVEAGWSADEAKEAVFDLCEQHRHAESLTLEYRRDLEQIANRLAGSSRLYVVSAGIRGSALAASFEETGIYDFDANRWMRALRDD